MIETELLKGFMNDEAKEASEHIDSLLAFKKYLYKIRPRLKRDLINKVEELFHELEG